MSRAIWLTLFGPAFWALAFSAIYALHGLGCESGWPSRSVMADISLHRATMLATWIAAIVVHAWSVFSPSFPEGALGALPRAGAWIGLVSTVFTLSPIVLTGAC